MQRKPQEGFNTKDIIQSLVLMEIIQEQAPLASQKLPAAKKSKNEEFAQIGDILPDAEKRKKIMEELKLSLPTLNKLGILNSTAASAFRSKLLLSDSEFTNNSIQDLLPHAKVSAESVISSYQVEVNECRSKLTELTGREKEIDELYEFVKKKISECVKKVRSGEKIGLADMQILESNALKFAKKVMEFNIVLTVVQKKQEKLYDMIAATGIPENVQNNSPKLRM